MPHASLGLFVLREHQLREYDKDLNAQDFSHGGQAISNEFSAEWM